MNITLEQAEKAIKAAKAKAQKLKVLMNIAVVDSGTNLVGFARMDDAWLGSIDIAMKKARTARYFNFPTGEIGKLSQPGGPLFNIEHSNGGLISFPGGVVIKNTKGEIIGAEIMDATLHILKAAGARIDIETIEIGEKVYLSGNVAGIAPESWESLRRTKVFLKAPITTPSKYAASPP